MAMVRAFLVPINTTNFLARVMASIYQIPLEEKIVLGSDGHNNNRIFASLRFVVRDGIGQNNLVQIISPALPKAEEGNGMERRDRNLTAMPTIRRRQRKAQRLNRF